MNAELEKKARGRTEQLYEFCRRCEGNGLVYADGKAHYPSEKSAAKPCPVCGGEGKTFPSIEAVAAVLLEAYKEGRKEMKEEAAKVAGNFSVHTADGQFDFPSQVRGGIAQAIRGLKEE